MSWPISRLDQLADTCLGKMLDKQKNRGIPQPYLRNSNVRWGTFDLSDLREMRFEPDEVERYSVKLGDLVVCEGGEPGRCAVWRHSEPIFIQKALHRIRCGSSLMPTFLHYYLMFLAKSGRLAKHFTGTTIHHLPGRVLATLDVPHPPTSEQHAIVAAIEAHFSRLDAAVASLKRARANVERARASVLQAAVEGRLVPTEAALARAEGRDYEPASALLERILAERRRRHDEAQAGAKRKKRYKEPVAPDTAGLPELPEGWCWATVDQLSGVVKNGYGRRPHDKGNVRILRISSVRPCQVDLNDHRLLQGELSDYDGAIAKPGHLLFTRYNGTPALVGVAGQLRGAEPVVHPDKLIRVELIRPLVAPSYVELAANAGVSRRHVEGRMRTTAGQCGISGGDLRCLPIPLPPLPEQHRIAAEVDRRLSVLDALDQLIATNLARCERLQQSILKRAFEGRLVPCPRPEAGASP